MQQECLFIDDTLLNVQAANKLGIKTLHFENATHMANGMILMPDINLN